MRTSLNLQKMDINDRFYSFIIHKTFKMNNQQKTLIIRHRRENLKKCSLRGLEKKEEFTFLSYPLKNLPNLDSTIILTVDAPPLTKEDSQYNLLLIDATWALAEKMIKGMQLDRHPLKRSLPGHYRTAYPRRQTHCPLPDQGLASVEALFIAFQIFGKNTEGLLDDYYWKEAFLSQNALL